MSTYLITIALIFGVVSAGVLVDRVYRNFARNNPQLGPFRDTDKCGSCSGGSGCDGGTCDSPR
jgi:hypothetical protein